MANCLFFFTAQGQTCTLRLVKKRGKGRAAACGQGPRGGEESAHGNDGGGGGGGGESKGAVFSRTWWDGFNKGRHSNAKNEVVCTCRTCGRKLCYGGSDVGVCANMRGARGRERRSERFRDRERAEKQLRLEKASAFIQSEGLSKAKDGKKKARGGPVDGNAGGILPATMSERAEASIVSSYTSHAINSYRTQYGDRGVGAGAGAGAGAGVGGASGAPMAPPVAASSSAAVGSKQRVGDASKGGVVGEKRSLEAGGEEGKKKKKKKKRESLESISAAKGGGTTARLGGGGSAGGGGGASGAAGGGPGQKKSLYDLMQGILGGP